MVILRGISGSGKSRYAEAYTGAVVVSADHFWIRSGSQGLQYDFDIKRIGAAHADALCKLIDAIGAGAPLIVVDNTHSRRWEYSAAERLAALHGYTLEIVEMDAAAHVDRCIARNIHDVPSAVIRKMLRHWEADDRATKVPCAFE